MADGGGPCGVAVGGTRIGAERSPRASSPLIEYTPRATTGSRRVYRGRIAGAPRRSWVNRVRLLGVVRGHSVRPAIRGAIVPAPSSTMSHPCAGDGDVGCACTTKRADDESSNCCPGSPEKFGLLHRTPHFWMR